MIKKRYKWYFGWCWYNVDLEWQAMNLISLNYLLAENVNCECECECECKSQRVNCFLLVYWLILNLMSKQCTPKQIFFQFHSVRDIGLDFNENNIFFLFFFFSNFVFIFILEFEHHTLSIRFPAKMRQVDCCVFAISYNF